MFDSIQKCLSQNGVFGLNKDTKLSQSDALMMMPIEIEKLDESQFLQVRETLQRVGIMQKGEDGKMTLWQTVTLLHKQGQYFLCHYKHMYMLDHRTRTQYALVDQLRLNAIAHLLKDWGLIKPINGLAPFDGKLKELKLSIVSFKTKNDFVLREKYIRRFNNKEGASN